MQRVISVAENKELASIKAARILCNLFWKSQGRKRLLFGTATGQTPILTYENFEKEFIYYRGLLNPWNLDYSFPEPNLRFIQLDNYISPGSGPETLPAYSYELELKNGIWKVPNGGCFIPKEYGNPEEEVKNYRRIIQAQLAWKDTYVQLLGIGDEDGHIAFNMPGTPFDSTVHVVDLNQETIKANAQKFFGGDETLVPKQAITTGIGDILKADVIILEAFGKKKANIIYKAFFEEPTLEIPASALQSYSGKLYVILDEEAASEIVKKVGRDVFR